MARRRRRKGLIATLFPEWHRAYRRVKHDMRPDRALGRVMSVPEIKSGLRSTFGTRTTKVTAATRQAQVQRASRPAAKKTAAKKTAAKRQDPYAVAAAIPGQNRTAAAKMAKAAQPAGKKKTYVQGRDGRMRGSKTFDGAQAMTDRDRATWQAALGGHIDPQLRSRTPRRRG